MARKWVRVSRAGGRDACGARLPFFVPDRLPDETPRVPGVVARDANGIVEAEIAPLFGGSERDAATLGRAHTGEREVEVPAARRAARRPRDAWSRRERNARERSWKRHRRWQARARAA